MERKRPRIRKSKAIQIIPLGGLDKIGMNITAIKYDKSIIVIDCGCSFPEEDMLGIDLVIPDVSYLKENIDMVKGFFITHGHEDHIGAIPYILKDIKVPIYATRLTRGLIEIKLKEHGMLEDVEINTVKHGEFVKAGDIFVEFIKMNHSVADAAALAIHSPAGVIVHTGDFKIDYTPLFGDTMDLHRFAELGSKGVLALMCDSTNAERPGFTMSEKSVAKTFDHLFSTYRDNRLIITTFASNVDRVQQILNTAHDYDRRVVIQGRSMVNIIAVASELGYIKIPDDTLIELNQMRNYNDNQLVIITTGSQGESMAALSRMANSTHPRIKINPNDVIIFSSSPIPGNEKSVFKVINELSSKGARVIYHDTHVSGHACQEEIKLIYTLIKPKYAVPIHGEYKHMCANARLAETTGVKKENIFLLENGNVLQLTNRNASVVGQVKTKEVFVDGLGVGDIGSIVLRDRQYLSENGLIIIVFAIDEDELEISYGPDIISRGFIYVRESDELMKDIKKISIQSIEESLRNEITDWASIKKNLKDDLYDFLWSKLQRRPLLLPIIVDL